MKKNMLHLCVFIIFLFSSLCTMFSQEALLSDAEKYYQFLSLEGEAKRPTLNYRTLSDSVWVVDESALINPWKDINLGRKTYLTDDISMRIYGPELFMSFNTAAPYGQNDGVLWQGKGFNTSLSGGVRFELFGVEATLKPTVTFSQNLAFDYVSPIYDNNNPLFTGKAGIFGYYGISSIDAPQRFGDTAFFDFSWGDSEVRYTWKTLTIGFGTQSPWIGPAYINPILHSNNAPPYPKIDIGIRKQSVKLFGINLGDIEARAWWGYLQESDYFDNNINNNENLITALALSYSPPFLQELTVGFNRMMLSKWNDRSVNTIFTLLWPFMDSDAGSDKADQRASITIDYLLPQAGLQIYLEFARNDYSPSTEHVIRYPFHTAAYTVGLKKAISIYPSKDVYGELLAEITMLETSADYLTFIPWNTTFYAHHIITQGHTNQGQWLGAGIGTGGNSQYLGFKVYYPKGNGLLFFQRVNPDNDYTWFIDSKNNGVLAEENMRVLLSFGLNSTYFLLPQFSLAATFIFIQEHNPLYQGIKHTGLSILRNNFHFEVALKYYF